MENGERFVEVSIKVGNIAFLILQFYILLREEDAKKKYVSLFIFTAFCEVFYNLGYLFKIGGYEINLPYISIIITTLWGILLLAKRVISFHKKSVFALMTFYSFLVLGLLWRLISPSEIIGINHYVQVDSLATGGSMAKLEVSGYSFLILIRTILCSLSIACFGEIFNRKVFRKVLNKYIPIFKSAIVFAAVEFISNNFINPNLVRNIVIALFGRVSGAYTAPSFRGMFYSICLTCWEPSLANYALMFCVLGLLWNINAKNDKTAFFYVAVAVLMMIISMSLTGLLFAAMVITFILFKKNVRDKSKKIIVILIPVTIVTGGFLMLSFAGVQNYLTDRLVRTWKSIVYMTENPQSLSIFNVFGGASETVRFYSMFNNIYVWTKSPLLGNGLGTVSSTSGWISALANVGIIGIYLLLKFNKWISKKVGLLDYKIAAFLIGVLFTLQGGLTDIFCSTYYYLWIIFTSEIISNYKIKRKCEIMKQNNKKQEKILCEEVGQS